MEQCTHNNLDKVCKETFELGLKLREYVNYGPRMSISEGIPKFGDCGISPQTLDDFISWIDDCIIKAIKWSNQYSTLENTNFTKLAIEQISQFFKNKDLFYLKWCNDKIINDAKLFYDKLLN